MEKVRRRGEECRGDVARRRLSPRLCGWLREVSPRATSPAAAAQIGAVIRWRKRRRRAGSGGARMEGGDWWVRACIVIEVD